ncbi:putative nucleotidyltransferase substrate binding domain-containing protein [Colwellia sp. 6_MG-2023]|uniref:putative nucleotidyltransferase substrate binding domain-containing protein n=1 Tax=Colwellia sp. 6_MG-2023 TaxID=3062676 RepID=UPI0026E17C8B|nr:putative nucleotidyltransferase substrate binding domain-containing protein [Colwellia sp. 6_MG-2023]MDO6486239.1 putative nucleotidyltransferase substrate binding domain-containing protein [Colwellia sp. 6_MG-2023]
MDTELSEIYSFIQSIPPFDSLPQPALARLIRELAINYVRKDEFLPPKGVNEARLYIVRKGALSCLSSSNELISRLGEGDLCTEFCKQKLQPISNTDEISGNENNTPLLTEQRVKTDEDSLVYSLDAQILRDIGEKYPSISDYFNHNSAERLKKKMSKINEEAIISSTLMNMPVSNFYHSPVAGIDASQSIQQAAIQMTEQGYTCLVVLDNKSCVGIVTDKDIRRRCVAEGLPITTSIAEIMTREMSTIDIKNNAYDALMTMTAKHIQHLPVTNQGEVVGMVTVTDLMNNEGHNTVNFSSIIHKAKSLEQLIEVSALLPKLQIRLAKLGASADHVGKSISAITMSFTKRLIEMAEAKLGPPPVPYAWLAAGSQARQEQLAHSDQDNAIIICDSMKPDDDAWFKSLAHFVCDGLADCGFIYCPGYIMATNDKWRQPVKNWQKYFDGWIDTPSPEALLNSSVFFDLETICGDTSLLDNVRTNLLKKTQNSSLFIAHLSKNALALRPPLGFFRDFVLKQNGKHKATLDLKHNGIAPIVDLARIYALSQGISAVNTIERIKQAAGSAAITRSSAENLIDAYEFLGILRVKHQANQLTKDIEPDNYLSPKELSKLEREHLKDAFKVIKTLQDSRQANF